MDGKNRVKMLINKLWKTDKIWTDIDFWEKNVLNGPNENSKFSYIDYFLFIIIHSYLLMKY
jgi:hypothetical protein